MPLAARTRLGTYEILGPLGAGGMGEVYRAKDLRLGREVAVKILPADVASSPDRLARLEREARTVAGLNHPNIVTLFSVEDEDGIRFLTMELVEGVSLSHLITPQGLPLSRVLELSIPLADALEAAHDRGVVHRDLKPGNVMVTREGRVKVLDFGLAKLATPDSDLSLSRTATISEPISMAGQAVGTVPYMAPEQIRGEAVDARTDLFAFGAMLYELAAGRRPFAGATAADISSAILRDSPPPLPEHVSPALREIIQRCLAKEREQRYRRASEVRAALETLRSAAAASSVTALARRTPRMSLRWIGAAVLIVGTVAVVLALNLGGLRQRVFGPPGAPQVQSLAVLPLENLTHDAAKDYFADGMTEALIAELSKIGALRVISRTSVMKYKGSKKTAPEVSRELGVDALIEGSVLREGDQVRITVQLIDGASDDHLWVESFDRKLAGILVLYSEVAQAIAGQIRVKLTPQERSRLAAAHGVNPQAYELYVLGRHYWNQRTIEGYRRASERFREALEIDPSYAPAHTALADTYMLLGEQGGLRQQEARSLAASEIRSAMELDPNLAEVQTSLGMWKLHYEWNWAESEQAFKRALELNPSFATAHQLYGRSLGFAGRFKEAFAELQRAKELDPLSATINAYIGQVLIFSRQYDKASEQLERTLELDPNHVLAVHNLGELYMAQGQFDEAVKELERSVELSGQHATSHYLAMLGCAYARARRESEARKVLSELEQRRKRDLVSAFDMASLYASFGDSERAIAWLGQGYERRDPWLIELNAWPWFDAQRGDPRFQDLLRRIGLSK
jgi:TolB-like protein/Tfp pilus assembly protein PilF